MTTASHMTFLRHNSTQHKTIVRQIMSNSIINTTYSIAINSNDATTNKLRTHTNTPNNIKQTHNACTYTLRIQSHETLYQVMSNSISTIALKPLERMLKAARERLKFYGCYVLCVIPIYFVVIVLFALSLYICYCSFIWLL